MCVLEVSDLCVSSHMEYVETLNIFDDGLTLVVFLYVCVSLCVLSKHDFVDQWRNSGSKSDECVVGDVKRSGSSADRRKAESGASNNVVSASRRGCFRLRKQRHVQVRSQCSTQSIQREVPQGSSEPIFAVTELECQIRVTDGDGHYLYAHTMNNSARATTAGCGPGLFMRGKIREAEEKEMIALDVPLERVTNLYVIAVEVTASWIRFIIVKRFQRNWQSSVAMTCWCSFWMGLWCSDTVSLTSPMWRLIRLYTNLDSDAETFSNEEASLAGGALCRKYNPCRTLRPTRNAHRNSILTLCCAWRYSVPYLWWNTWSSDECMPFRSRRWQVFTSECHHDGNIGHDKADFGSHESRKNNPTFRETRGTGTPKVKGRTTFLGELCCLRLIQMQPISPMATSLRWTAQRSRSGSSLKSVMDKNGTFIKDNNNSTDFIVTAKSRVVRSSGQQRLLPQQLHLQ